MPDYESRKLADGRNGREVYADGVHIADVIASGGTPGSYGVFMIDRVRFGPKKKPIIDNPSLRPVPDWHTIFGIGFALDMVREAHEGRDPLSPKMLGRMMLELRPEIMAAKLAAKLAASADQKTD